mmetsp:Transcript_10462/g.29264  ORF Transcript_10462/g.29264 Transcript_10462/m.29264 type:complete len:273 (-) Transcript_10462:690-1508(-)
MDRRVRMDRRRPWERKVGIRRARRAREWEVSRRRRSRRRRSRSRRDNPAPIFHPLLGAVDVNRRDDLDRHHLVPTRDLPEPSRHELEQRRRRSRRLVVKPVRARTHDSVEHRGGGRGQRLVHQHAHSCVGTLGTTIGTTLGTPVHRQPEHRVEQRNRREPNPGASALRRTGQLPRQKTGKELFPEEIACPRVRRVHVDERVGQIGDRTAVVVVEDTLYASHGGGGEIPRVVRVVVGARGGPIEPFFETSGDGGEDGAPRTPGPAVAPERRGD